MMGWLAWIAAAYLTGSIPFGLLIGKARGIDIRTQGSGNIGATNVGRVLGKKLGAVCFVLDFLKGAGPVLGAGITQGVLGRPANSPNQVDLPLTTSEMWLWLAVVAGAIAGHIFPVFLKFRGGKGVATALGALVVMWQPLTLPAIGALLVWYAVLRLFRYVSLASISAVISLPIGYLASIIPPNALDQPLLDTLRSMSHAYPPFVGTSLIAALVIYRHRANIVRLRRGDEPQVGDHHSRM